MPPVLQEGAGLLPSKGIILQESHGDSSSLVQCQCCFAGLIYKSAAAAAVRAGAARLAGGRRGWRHPSWGNIRPAEKRRWQIESSASRACHREGALWEERRWQPACPCRFQAGTAPGTCANFKEYMNTVSNERRFPRHTGARGASYDAQTIESALKVQRSASTSSAVEFLKSRGVAGSVICRILSKGGRRQVAETGTSDASMHLGAA